MSEAPDGPIPPLDSSTPEPVEPRAQSDQSSSVSNAKSNADAPERRVARTMLDISHIPKKSNRRVAKTLQEQAVPSPDMQPAKSARYVAKTMLDHSLLFQAVSQSANRLEHKAAEIAKERAQEPVELIEPIVADGKVSGCKWSWTDASNRKERYRACGVCQTAIYDFEGLEQEPAAAIVFQRENLKKPKFYLRTDGKFMTRQCPREVSRKLRMISLSVLGVISLLSAILLMVLLGQSSKIQPVTSISPDESGANSSIRSNQSSAVISKENSSTISNGTSSPNGVLSPSTTSTTVPPGMFHYENGKVTRGAMPTSAQEAPSAPSNAGAPGESEPMWQDTSK
ncbi:MAG: hypothetical protein EKK48_15235 [Candidatus Melainabacteria bacterium]|nr:MAG: hypothetical protein EKK48_15235 [Candidatus Melainabacteria bacterium]